MIDRLNRIVLWVVGAVLVAASVLGLLAQDGVLDLDEPSRIYTDVQREIDDRPELWWTIVIAACAVLLVLGILWARRQLVRRGGTGISTTTLQRTRRGDLTVEPVAVARAVETDLTRIPGVVDSRVRLLELGDTTELRARLQLARHVDLDTVRDGIGSVLDRMKGAVGAKEVKARVRLDLAEAERSRVA